MPRITFEYTDNLAIRDEIDAFIKNVHEDLVRIIQTDLSTCRTVIQRHEDYLIGDGDVKNAFIQLSIKMLPGRSNLIKNKLAHCCWIKSIISFLAKYRSSTHKFEYT